MDREEELGWIKLVFWLQDGLLVATKDDPPYPKAICGGETVLAPSSGSLREVPSIVLESPRSATLCVWGLLWGLLCVPDSDLLVLVRQGGRLVGSEECTEEGWESRLGDANDTDRPLLRMNGKFVPYTQIPD